MRMRRGSWIFRITSRGSLRIPSHSHNNIPNFKNFIFSSFTTLSL
nr:MAG TPA: hypothetical protein [Crassvirales sp.]